MTLRREPGLTGESSHDLGNDLIQVRVVWTFELQFRMTDIIERFILQASVNTRQPLRGGKQLTSIQHVMSLFSTRL